MPAFPNFLILSLLNLSQSVRAPVFPSILERNREKCVRFLFSLIWYISFLSHPRLIRFLDPFRSVPLLK